MSKVLFWKQLLTEGSRLSTFLIKGFINHSSVDDSIFKVIGTKIKVCELSTKMPRSFENLSRGKVVVAWQYGILSAPVINKNLTYSCTLGLLIQDRGRNLLYSNTSKHV